MTAALAPIIKKMQEHGASIEQLIAFQNGFTTGAMWRASHPHWIKVEEELPNDENEVVIGIDVKGGLHFITKPGIICCNSSPRMNRITHWRREFPPLLANSAKTGKKYHLIDGNKMVDYFILEKQQ